MPDPLRPTLRERLDAVAGWQPAAPPKAADGVLEVDGALVLAAARDDAEGRPVPLRPIPDTEPSGTLGGRTLPRGLAISRTDEIYLADPGGGRVLFTRATLPPAPVADTPAPFVPLWRLGPGADAAHPLALKRPVDLCLVSPDAGVGQFADALVVAEAGERYRLIWLDRHRATIRHILPLEAPPLAIAALEDGRIAVLTDGTVRFVSRGTAGRGIAIGPRATQLVARRGGGLYIVGRGGVQMLDARDRGAEAEVDPVPAQAGLMLADGVLSVPARAPGMDPWPMPHLAVDNAGRLAGTDLPLVAVPRQRAVPRAGTWLSAPLDGGAMGFAWDRVALEARVLPECRLLVSTAASDIADEPAPDWDAPFVIESDRPAAFLVQRGRGRYLRLRIEAFGDGRSTPSVTGIDVFGPRHSQHALLPAPFHADPVSADFLDRYLSLQDGFLAEALAAFERMGAILDPEATPPEFLDWLGGWLDWTFLADWSPATRREMIARAFEFFALRGTVRGIELMLRWHTRLDPPLPRVVEGFRLAREGADAPLAGGGVDLGTAADGAHLFFVVVPKIAAPDAATRATLQRLIDAQKPAHTVGHLVIAAPGLIPGRQARPGLDAVLPDRRTPPLGDARLDINAATTPHAPPV